MTRRRCVVVGDVVESRAVEDREALHGRLESGMERANEAVGDRLVAPFTTLKGVDEVGGVLADPGRAYQAVRELTDAIHPTSIRFAVVWGRVDVGTDADDVARMDGPAFHEADDLLGAVERADRYVGLSVAGTDEWLVDLLTNQADLICMWKAGWTGRQMEVARLYRELGTMAAVSDRLDVSVQSVSQTLGRAEAATIMGMERDLQTAMAELWGDLAR
jgi:hypothetical protein